MAYNRRMKIQSYKDLVVWQKSIGLVDHVYTLTRALPKSETFGLSTQMRRAAVSIPSNIAEGYKRNYILEYIQFLNIAFSSTAELETQLLIAANQYKPPGYNKTVELLDEVQRMLLVLIRQLKAKQSQK
jgi:four helix bundle protein